MTLKVTNVQPQENTLAISFSIVGERTEPVNDVGVIHYYGTLAVDKDASVDAVLSVLRQAHDQLYADSYKAFCLKHELDRRLGSNGHVQ